MQSEEMLDVILVMHVEMYFSIFCLCPAAVLKKILMACTALLSRSCMDPGVSKLQEHGAVLGRSLRSHCMDSKVENESSWSALPPLKSYCLQEHLLLLVETVLSLQASAVSLSVTFLPHTQACPAGNLRLGED